MSERESVGARLGPGLTNGGGKEAPSSSSSAGSKRKRDNLDSNQTKLNEPGTLSSSSGDSTWSIDSLNDRHQFSLSRNKNDHSEHSITSAGVTIRQPLGVLRLRNWLRMSMLRVGLVVVIFHKPMEFLGLPNS